MIEIVGVRVWMCTPRPTSLEGSWQAGCIHNAFTWAGITTHLICTYGRTPKWIMNGNEAICLYNVAIFISLDIFGIVGQRIYWRSGNGFLWKYSRCGGCGGMQMFCYKARHTLCTYSNDYLHREPYVGGAEWRIPVAHEALFAWRRSALTPCAVHDAQCETDTV